MTSRLPPLQNRVLPTGEIVAIPARGAMMGNRGGALHDDKRQLSGRRWVSRQWICCVLAFNGRKRQVMAPRRYTELFFLDEATALSAGHRPCFECRRAAAMSFAAAWSTAAGLAIPPKAADMDRQLHKERLDEAGAQRRHVRPLAGLPDGAIYLDGNAHTPRLVLGDITLAWSPVGYHQPSKRSRETVAVLTPPCIIAALCSGYRAMLHVTARDPR